MAALGRGLGYTVVHSLPGRVRLRLSEKDSEHGSDVVRLLSGHPSVRGVRWVKAVRSLTVEFDRGVSLPDILRNLPEQGVPETVGEEPQGALWRQFLLPAVSIAAGFSGLGLLSRVVVALCVTPIARRAVKSLVSRRLTIDVLDVTAMSLLLAIGDTMAAGVSVALIETGERIRQRASGRARRVLRKWMGDDARGVRLQLNGTEPRVPLESVAIGDRVVVYAGETIPVDGSVVSGSGSIDNRTWTGESMPVPAQPGHELLAGSTLIDGRVVIEVAATGESTRAGRLAIALESAIAADTRISDMARRIADRFVAPVFIAGGAVFLVTRDLSRVIAMLIMDFGTGVRISIPTAILSTMVIGARHEILFKQGRSVEELAKVDTIVFDKTGTLTLGRPEVVEVIPLNGWEPSAALRLAASAEGHLPHPFARALRRSARRQGLQFAEPDFVRYEPGGGVVAKVDGHAILVGGRNLMEMNGIQLGASDAGDAASHVRIAIDGKVAARVRLQDQINESAREAIAGLKREGITQIWLATGDREPVARHVAAQLGLDHVAARMMPEDKAELVRRLRHEGRRVALVGDGINDSAALAQADVGIAVSRGADLAREVADVILMSEDLEKVVEAVRLARQAMSIVRENIALVAVPNAGGLGVAVAGALNPLTATLMNNGSTLLAEANALRPLVFAPARAAQPDPDDEESGA